MAFNVTYGSLLDRNINHLYTTRQKTMHRIVPRQKFYRPEFLELERQANARHENRSRRKPKLNMEYVSEFDIEVPRAPAFRTADKSYVDEIVARLNKRSRIKANPRGCWHYQRDSQIFGWEKELNESPHDTVSNRRMNSIVNRLNKHAGCGRKHSSPSPREEDYLPEIGRAHV